MRRGVAGACLALAIYSILLMAVEVRHGTETARTFLDDPAEPVLFGHVNTSLSAALLAGAALLFAIRSRAGGGPRLFPVSQTTLLLVLAADERFRLVASAARGVGVPELLLYALVAAIELALLLGPGRLLQHRRQLPVVAGAGALYTLSFLLDQTGPHWTLRDCAEELPKVWAGGALLLFAWRRMEDRIALRPAGRATAGLAATWSAAERRRPSLVARAAALAMEGGELDEFVGSGSRAAAGTGEVPAAPKATPTEKPEPVAVPERELEPIAARQPVPAPAASPAPSPAASPSGTPAPAPVAGNDDGADAEGVPEEVLTAAGTAFERATPKEQSARSESGRP